MILDTFYLLFKSNASDIIKGNKEVEKSTKQLGESLKDTGEGAEKLGDQYVRVVESATQALTAVISIRSIAGGIFRSANVNSDLQIQSKLIGQSVIDLKAYGNAIEALGGDSAGFRGNIQGIFEQISAVGGKLPSIDKIFEKFRTVLKGANGDLQQQEFLFQKLGISDPAFKSLLLLPDEEFRKEIQLQKELASSTKEGAEKAREFEHQWNQVKSSLEGVFTSMGNDLLPVLTIVSEKMVEFFDYLKDNPKIAEGLSAGIVALGGSITLVLIPALGSVATILAGIATSIAALTVAIGSVGAIADAVKNGDNSFLGKIGRRAANWIDGTIHGDEGILRDPPVNSITSSNRENARINSSPLSNRESDLKFWISKGYTKEQAAAWLSTAESESNNNPNAIGDNGKSRGLFQWKKDRRDLILNGTGIDVYNAPRQKQLEAAAWEAHQRGNDVIIKRTKSADAAAEVLTKYFERPSNIPYQSLKRGKLALQIANNIPLASIGGENISNNSNRNINVKIGDINITAATNNPKELANHIGLSIADQIRGAMANLDDGVMR